MEGKEKMLEHLDLYKEAIENGSITKIIIFYMDKNEHIGAAMSGITRKHELIGMVHVGLEDILEHAKKVDAEDAEKNDVA